MITGPWLRRAGLIAAGALMTTAPVLLAEPTSEEAASAPVRALGAGAAWRDVLEAYRAPQLPPPGDTESAVVELKDPPVAAFAPADRPAAAARIAQEQALVEPVLAGLGATVNFRYRMLVNGFGIQLPAGRLALVAALPEVRSITPVTYLAPAEAAAPDPSGATPTAAQTPPPEPASVDPAHIALVDAGIRPEHLWLGGAIGPDRLIVGGADLVNGNPGPEANPSGRNAEAHGTELASIVLRSPALAGLPPASMPRLLAYRVVAREQVEGSVRALARSDRVIDALELAVDPNRDGDAADRAEVILMGLSRGFDGGGVDPVDDALRAADNLGALVVVPAGNDGPTFGPVGTVGGPAAAPGVLTVGGLAAATTPRTADLQLEVGPASASLTSLPLLGADPSGESGPVVVLAGRDGLASGDHAEDYVDAQGHSRVAGAIAVVGRDGSPLTQKARLASQAGAAGLAVWDQDGAGLFPGPQGGAAWPIPVVGLGARQGQVLIEHPGFAGRIVARPVAPQGAAVASFSSRGPTASGSLGVDLVAPAVDVEAAYPGVGPGGDALVGRLSGTSGAAAEVAAMALRLRVDHPGLRPDDVRSLLVQAAAPLPGVDPVDQGAGVATMPASLAAVAIDPAIISATRPPSGSASVVVALRDLTGAAARYRLAVQAADGTVTSAGTVVDLPPDERSGIAIDIPGGPGRFSGRLLVQAEDGTQVASAPIFAAPLASTPDDALGPPVVHTSAGVTDVRVRVGLLRRSGEHLRVAPLHNLGMWLIPSGGEAPIRMVGAKQGGDWPPGTYRFVLSRRQADGRELPAGRYRLRVMAFGSDGQPVAKDSADFRLG